LRRLLIYLRQESHERWDYPGKPGPKPYGQWNQLLSVDRGRREKALSCVDDPSRPMRQNRVQLSGGQGRNSTIAVPDHVLAGRERSLNLRLALVSSGTIASPRLPSITGKIGANTRACFRQRAGHWADLSNQEESVDFTTADDEQVKLSVTATVTGEYMVFSQDGQRPVTNGPSSRHQPRIPNRKHNPTCHFTAQRPY
jgi:hypothetical protein